MRLSTGFDVVRFTNRLNMVRSTTRQQLTKYNKYEIILDTFVIEPEKVYSLHRDIKIRRKKMKNGSLRVMISVRQHESIIVKDGQGILLIENQNPDNLSELSLSLSSDSDNQED